MTASEAKEILECWAIGMKPYHGHETEEDVKRLDALWMGIHALDREIYKEEKGFWTFEGRLLKCSKCGNLYDECTDYCPFCGSPMYTMTLEQYKKYVRDQANDIYISIQ